MRTLALAAALGMAFGAAPAHAMLQIAVDVDGFTEHDSSPTGSLVVPAFTLDGVTVSGSLSQSFGTPRTPNGTNFLNTSSLQVTNNSGALRTIEVTVGDTDFHAPVWYAFTAGSGVWADAGLLSHITMNWFGDALNRQGATTVSDTPGTLLDTFSNTSDGGLNDSFSHNGKGEFPSQLTSPFSFTEQATFTLINGGMLINRGQSVAAVPEPSTWAMMLIGFAGLAWGHMTRRRMRTL